MRTLRHRRIVAAAVGLVTAGALLTGCSSGASGEDSGGKVTLTFQSLAFADSTVKATKDIVDSWNASHPNIQVKLRQGSWDSVHDQLVTQFQGGTAPDLIHEAADDIQGFASQGYLANLKPYLSSDVKSAVSSGVWKTVTSSDGHIFAAPTLIQSYVVFANTDAFAAAGVDVPTGKTLSWDDFQTLAKKLSGNGKYGVGWGLKSPTATVMNLALNFGGTFFSSDPRKNTISVGSDELQVPKRIGEMAEDDRSIDPTSLTQSGSDVLPGFYGGKYAMYVGGNYIAQQITESAPAGFHWTVLPVLAGSKGSAQAADPQTLSVSAQSKHVKQAAQFVNYWMSAKNQAALAQGDWLVPASAPARDLVAKETGGKNGWDVALAAGAAATSAPFLAQQDYPQWNDQTATPALQKYFAGDLSLDQLKSQLTSGWQSVSGGS